LKLPIFINGDEAQILRINVYIIGRRHSYTDLEFARKIHGPIYRFFPALLAIDHFLTVKPDLVIGVGLWRKMVAKALRPLVNFRMNLRLVRVGVAHDIPIHITASG
jgi:hypothetical protein